MTEPKVVERRVMDEHYIPNGTTIYWSADTQSRWRIVAERLEEEPSEAEKVALKLDLYLTQYPRWNFADVATEAAALLRKLDAERRGK